MRKRRFLLLSLLVLVAIMVPFLFFGEEHRFTSQQCNRLKVGMTRGEVIQILGWPAGDYTNGKGHYLFLGVTGTTADAWHPGTNPDKTNSSWCGEYGAIWAHFDDDGKLTETTYWHPREAPPSIWTRIKCWLKL
jgi:hypothetical protein